MRQRLESPHRRLSPRERFVSVLKRGTPPGPPITAWYRQKWNFYTLLTLVLFVIFYWIVQATMRVENHVSPESEGRSETSRPAVKPRDSGQNSETMDYEEARRIFNAGR